MSTTIEDRLRRVLAATAMQQVPDDILVPPLPRGDAAVRPARRWVTPVMSGVAAAAVAVVATVIVVRSQPSGPDSSGVPVTVGTATHGSATPSGTTPSGTTPSTTTPSSATSSANTSRASSSVRAVSVRVPDLIGKTYQQAAADLQALGLPARRVAVDGRAPLDTVLSVAGTTVGAQVPVGTTVQLRVSNNELFRMPSLAGLTVQQAATALQALGWRGTSRTLTVRPTATVDQALVGRIPTSKDKPVQSSGAQLRPQVPAAGSDTRKSATITVSVYSKRLVVLPSFVPQVSLFADVQSQLAAVGFSNVIYRQVYPAVPPNVPFSFISVSGAAPGQAVPYDTPITVTVWGTAPPPDTPTSTG